MKRIFVLAIIAITLSVFCVDVSLARLNIVVEPNRGWGDAPTSNIKRLCENITLHFQEQLRDEKKLSGTIRIIYNPNNPSFHVDDDGSKIIRLAVTDTYWSQFSYQFAHEFCHAIEIGDPPFYPERDIKNNWFREALAELASVWAIRRMSETWAYRAPYANWVDYRHALAEYAQGLLDTPATQYSGSGKEWLEQWEEKMRVAPYAPSFTYARVSQLSYKFLPIFEDNPKAWNAIRKMPISNVKLSEYMPLWYSQAAAEDKSTVKALAEVMGIRVESPVFNPNTIVEGHNVLMYTGAVSWMSLDDANRQSQITKQLLASKGIQAEIVQTEDAVRDWMLQTTSDGNVDVLILYGTLPISIYPRFNSQPDGSVAENWIESTDGNTILNHGDYFGFWAGGHQEELGNQNGIQALQAIMDIPHITMWDFGLENNTPMIVTKDGKEVTPSLTNFKSDRAFHLDELTGNWFAEKVLASDTGTSQATRADPVIVRDGNRGRIGIVYQTFNEINPKGKVVAELIANFLLKNNDQISLAPVEPIIDSDTVSLLPISVQSPNIGQLLKFSLKITNGENIAGYQATVSFDTTALRYVGSSNEDYLPAGAYVLPPIMTDNTLTLAATSLSGESQGDGILATLTFEVVAVKASTVSLSDVLLTNGSGGSSIPQTENAEITEPTHLTQRPEDVNKDGVVNIVDLTLVASNFGKSGENAADVNADGVVNIVDLALVAGSFGDTYSAPGIWHPDLAGSLTKSEIKQELHHARQLNQRDPIFQRGLLILEQLLASLPPKETALLPNYPNPFNPETWIPYQLSEPADVTVNIYAVSGTLVRTLLLGYQLPGYYTDKNQAAYWNGCNNLGEPVANGIYFYQLQTNEISPLRKMVILK